MLSRLRSRSRKKLSSKESGLDELDDEIFALGTAEDVSVYADEQVLYFFQDQIQQERVFFVVDEEKTDSDFISISPSSSPRAKNAAMERFGSGENLVQQEEEESKTDVEAKTAGHGAKITTHGKKIVHWMSAKTAFFVV